MIGRNSDGALDGDMDGSAESGMTSEKTEKQDFVGDARTKSNGRFVKKTY